MPKSLKDFVGTGKPNRVCLVCSAPKAVRDQVEANEMLPREERVSRKLVSDWAKSEYDYLISGDTIYRHTRDHV